MSQPSLLETSRSSRPSPRFRRWFTLLLVAGGLVAAYFIHVEVQSALGRRALAATGLQSLALPEAIARARAENKPVLVVVSAIWCPSCRRLDQTVFADASVREFVQTNLVFSRLEYESPEGQAFLAERGATGFPTLWLLERNAEIVRRLPLTFAPAAFLAEVGKTP